MAGYSLVQKSKKHNTAEKVLAGDDEDDFELNLRDRDEFPPAVGAEKKRKRKQEVKERDLGGYGSLGKPSTEEVPKKQPKKEKQKAAVKEQQAHSRRLAEAKSETVDPQAETPEEAKKQAERAAAKVLKRKQAKVQRKAKKLSIAGFELSRIAAKNVATAPLEDQAEWLWKSFSAITKATQLERAGFEESAMAAFRGGESLEERLCGFKKGWRQELATSSGVQEEGSPRVVFICASAVTANNLAKQFPTLGRGCRIGKLFAKHFKVEEQQKDLRRAVNIATGTPNRMDKLAELGNLKFDSLDLAVVDVALDAKQMTILDIPDLKSDFWLFFKRHLQPRLASGTAKVALLDSSTL